ncbi:MAG: hypothetical protein IT580_13190, partial [Verrucomicrobiales bacterium]|nr:hypothetical protein [Verrucomicrobiales bacterium]
MWWTWTAPASGGLRISARGSEFFAKSLLLFTGNALEALTPVAEVSGDQTAELVVVGGQSYQIALVTAEEQSGSALLLLDHEGPPGNDAFARRRVLHGARVEARGTLLAATAEASEPLNASGFAAGNSVWWEWTAPADGALTAYATEISPRGFQSLSTEFFTGDTVTNLVPFGRLLPDTPRVRAGQTLVIRVASAPEPPVGDLLLHLELDGAHFSAPASGRYDRLSALPVSVAFTDADLPVAQVEFQLPDPTGTALEVRTQPPWSITWIPRVRGTVQVRATVTYTSGPPRTLVSEELRIEDARPENDLLSAAALVPPEGGTLSVQRLEGATLDADEEARLWSEVYTPIGSAWWLWKPARSGPAELLLPDSLLARVFRGPDLQPVPGVLSNRRLRFTATQGEDLWIGIRPAVALEEIRPASFSVILEEDSTRPPHDDFAHRAALPPDALVALHLENATVEQEELRQTWPWSGLSGPADRSLWWSWTSPGSGTVRFEEWVGDELLRGGVGSFVPAPIEVYRGTQLDGLTAAPNQIENTYGRRFSSHVEPGDTLVLRAVASATQSPSELWLRAEWIPDPPNDAFAQRTALTGWPILERVTVPRNASTEPGEPLRKDVGFAPKTLWWTWTSPVSAPVMVAAHGFTAVTRVAAYVGDTLATLQAAPGTTNAAGMFVLQATQGDTYQIQITTADETQVFLHVSEGAANDAWANAPELPVNTGIVAFNNLGATHEALETTTYQSLPTLPRLPLSGSLWWRWTAPADGVLTLRYWPFLWVLPRSWTGTSLSELVEQKGVGVEGERWTTTRLPVVSGQTYEVSLDTLASLSGGTPIPQSVLLDAQFTTLRLESPAAAAEYAYSEPIPVRVAPPSASIDGEIRRVRFQFNLQGAPLGTSLPYPAVSSVFRVGSPLEYTLTNWPCGRYEVVVYAATPQGQPLESEVRRFAIGPENDRFTSRTPLVANGEPSRVATLAGSTREAFESTLLAPEITGTTWWEWVASRSGSAFLTASAECAVFTGTNAQQLSQVAVIPAGETFKFHAEAHQAYQIALLRRTRDGSGGPADLALDLAPANDTFAQREAVRWNESPSGLTTESREFITRRASLDETEPDHGYPDQSGSLWWELSPPQGRLHIRL